MPAYIHSDRVAFHETDAAGIAHFSSYFLYAEEAETAALASLGIFSAESLARYVFPRVQASASYTRPLRFHEAYEAQAAITHIGNSSLKWHVDIISEKGPCACVELITSRRLVTTGEAAPYTPAEQEALKTLMPMPGAAPAEQP